MGAGGKRQTDVGRRSQRANGMQPVKIDRRVRKIGAYP